MGLLKTASIAAAVLAPVLGLSSLQVASADTGPSDIVWVTGNGTINPGLPTTGCASTPPHVTFSGVMTLTPNSDDAVYSGSPFGFDGTDTSPCPSAQSGSGSGVLTGMLSGNVSFTRTGTEVSVTGTAVLDGETHSINANCEFVPTNANPTRAYQLACQAVLSS